MDREIHSFGGTGEIEYEDLSAPFSDLSDALRVFRAARSADDDLTPAALVTVKDAFRNWSSGVHADLGPGVPRVGESRRVMIGTGQQSSDFYVLPTSRGWICYLITGIGQRCVRHLVDGISWASDYAPAANGYVVWVHGLAADDVASVTVSTADGSLFAASLEDNAFFLEFTVGASPANAIRSISVRFSDGRLVIAPARE